MFIGKVNSSNTSIGTQCQSDVLADMAKSRTCENASHDHPRTGP